MNLLTRVYMVLIYLMRLHHLHLHLDILARGLIRSSKSRSRTYTHSKSMDKVSQYGRFILINATQVVFYRSLIGTGRTIRFYVIEVYCFIFFILIFLKYWVLSSLKFYIICCRHNRGEICLGHDNVVFYFIILSFLFICCP